MLAFVVLISPIAGNGVMPEKIDFYCKRIRDLPGGSDGKLSAYNVRDLALIPGSGRSFGEGNGNHSSTLAWKIPWMEEPGMLQSVGSQSRTRLSDFTSSSPSHINMKQTQAYIYRLPPEPLSYLPPHSTPLGFHRILG